MGRLERSTGISTVNVAARLRTVVESTFSGFTTPMAGAGTSGGSDPKVLQSVVWGRGSVSACQGGMVGLNLRA